MHAACSSRHEYHIVLTMSCLRTSPPSEPRILLMSLMRTGPVAAQVTEAWEGSLKKFLDSLSVSERLKSLM